MVAEIDIDAFGGGSKTVIPTWRKIYCLDKIINNIGNNLT